jgi:hypothetical protein
MCICIDQVGSFSERFAIQIQWKTSWRLNGYRSSSLSAELLLHHLRLLLLSIGNCAMLMEEK